MSAKYPITPAVRMLRARKVEFVPHLYAYEPHGGTRVSARELGVDEHQVIKTLVFENENKEPLIVLMYGDCEVSAKQLAREIGVKQLLPCEPAVAQKHTGYQVGGTSPFGLRKALPIYMEAGIAALPCIYINGGKRGFLVEINPADLTQVLPVHAVEVAV